MKNIKLKIKSPTILVISLMVMLFLLFATMSIFGLIPGSAWTFPKIAGSLAFVGAIVIFIESLWDGKRMKFEAKGINDWIALVVAVFSLIIGLLMWFGITMPDTMKGLLGIDYIALLIYMGRGMFTTN